MIAAVEIDSAVDRKRCTVESQAPLGVITAREGVRFEVKAGRWGEPLQVESQVAHAWAHARVSPFVRRNSDDLWGFRPCYTVFRAAEPRRGCERPAGAIAKASS